MDMNEMNKYCMEHSGVLARLDHVEDVTKSMDKEIGVAHQRIDGMKNWVIAGMTSLILQLLVMILGLVLVWARTKV
jgi:hypothetical protein